MGTIQCNFSEQYLTAVRLVGYENYKDALNLVYNDFDVSQCSSPNIVITLTSGQSVLFSKILYFVFYTKENILIGINKCYPEVNLVLDNSGMQMILYKDNIKNKVINVLIGIDADSIFNDRDIPISNEPNHPTHLSLEQVNANIVMMTNPQSRGSVNNAELRINTYTSDTIQWRAGTFSLGSEWHTVLYECVVTAGANLIHETEFIVSPLTVPVPSESGNHLAISSELIHSDYWTTTTTDEPGCVTYTFKFAIYDRGLNVKGYYSWDLFMQISV
ncbi:AidA/PixA family protein [Moorena producens]|uniref:AidA/PixA family protein n=1 Tax=Moorena producens TaxID=1155739 RepID=UPI003C726933